MIKKVAILLSTYNGEQYLKDELDSIFNQKSSANIDVFVRDDGSSDATLSILEEYESVQIFPSPNVGVIKSFFDLVTRVKGYEAYFFCDQDDVWLEDKVERACQFLSTTEPALYSSALKVVDHELNFLKLINEYSNLNYENSLVEAVGTGCTMAFNDKFRTLALKVLDNIQASDVIMHDSLFIKIASINRTVIHKHDDYAGILYRQHANNVVGAKVNIFSKVNSFITHRFGLDNQRANIKEFRAVLQLTEDKEIRQEANELFYGISSNLFNRLNYIRRVNRFKRNSFMNVLFCLYTIAGIHK
ncbi:glycosyltransferase [Vibrio algivorus]|uniref:Glycosyltransferase 2-like domain-containing protein n=1 Tax=Vibrio algivorus TaxID=1667024 RepID=A0ABQ6EJ83_9VIBR|nr:glycosyltransferase [Vibrio algivorus]GLT13177.1 hypothetical protein GCM10007931_01510 [Vibrio algivorus]